MAETVEPIPVRFPLSGEWCAANTPGHKVPSHGTDQLGQRYAYDFFQIDWNKKGYRFYKAPVLRSIIFGVQLKDNYCWSEPIYSPFDGEVVEARDGIAERNPIHIARDLAIVLKNGFFFRGGSNVDLHPVLGNFIILKKTDGIYCLIAHAQTGSIAVSAGQVVKEGDKLARVGHSGNSTAPHLHFQLMDRQALMQAEGLPCCFKHYQVYNEGQWVSVENGIPGRRVRICA